MIASRVICAVTNGLPSRSPPIQLPNRRYARALGGRCADSPGRAWSDSALFGVPAAQRARLADRLGL